MSYIQNFKHEIIEKEEELGEKIILATWNKFEGMFFTQPDPKYAHANAVANTLCSRELTLEVMNYEHNSSWGSQECHNIVAWTPNYVIYIHEYDGSTRLEHQPRNPTVS